MKSVRVSVKALIIQDGRLLAVQKRGEDGSLFYALPGGGQKVGETLIEAVGRECREELNIAVEVGPLVFIRDYIGANHEFARFDPDVHFLNLVFACRVLSGTPGAGGTPDRRQVGLAWLALDELERVSFFPRAGAGVIRRWAREGLPAEPLYLGDVN